VNPATFGKLQQMSEQNLLDIDQAKREGGKVIGFYCLYSPVELAIAAGAIPVSLCGTKNDPIEPPKRCYQETCAP